jgi:hypothetical protein
MRGLVAVGIRSYAASYDTRVVLFCLAFWCATKDRSYRRPKSLRADRSREDGCSACACGESSTAVCKNAASFNLRELGFNGERDKLYTFDVFLFLGEGADAFEFIGQPVVLGFTDTHGKQSAPCAITLIFSRKAFLLVLTFCVGNVIGKFCGDRFH